MEQYILKSALVAEIEKRKSELQSRIAELGTFESNTLGLFQEVDLYDDILSFLNTLEVKEMDLEKYYHDFLQKEWFDKNCCRTISEMMAFTAKHFFELGLSSQLSWKDIELIAKIGMDFMNSEDSDNLNDEEYYTEILNRFKAQKGEKV